MSSRRGSGSWPCWHSPPAQAEVVTQKADQGCPCRSGGRIALGGVYGRARSLRVAPWQPGPLDGDPPRPPATANSGITLAGIQIGERPHRHVNVLVEEGQGRWIVLARGSRLTTIARAARSSFGPAGPLSTQAAGRRSPMPFSGKRGRPSSGWSPSGRTAAGRRVRSPSKASRRATCPRAPRPSLSVDASTWSRPIPPPRSTGARPATALGKGSTSSSAVWAPLRDTWGP